jgi:hypothetical protein
MIVSVGTSLRWPISVGAIGPKSGVGSMFRSMLMQLQGLFRLAKIEL